VQVPAAVVQPLQHAPVGQFAAQQVAQRVVLGEPACFAGFTAYRLFGDFFKSQADEKAAPDSDTQHPAEAWS
jgi:hypothetical protein